MNIVLNIT